MKKTIIYGLLGMFLLSGAVTSCSKYEEGSKFTVLTKKARLVGKWKISKIEYNGVAESTIPNTTIEIKKTGDYNASYSYTFFGQTQTSTASGTWELSSDKSKLLMTETGQSSIDSEEIIELKNKEIKLKDVNGSTVTITTYTAL
ncbi:MAG: lipocalin family protein [Flavobacteriia bacterium]|nr:lipocalin family protein [Flavobacteriia bacterium]